MLDNYVCADSGYVESCIADREKLREIVAKWPEHKESKATLQTESSILP